jgi:hypothetical protein
MQTAHYDVVTCRAFHASGSLGAPQCPGTGSNELKNWGRGRGDEDCRTIAVPLVQILSLCVSVGSGERKELRGPLQREPSASRTKHLPTYLPLVEVGNCLIKTRQRNMSHTSYTASRCLPVTHLGSPASTESPTERQEIHPGASPDLQTLATSTVPQIRRQI